MSHFNLSEWAVRHRTLVLFFMLLCVVMGVRSYWELGRQEDPDFSVPTMVIQTNWPGATAADTMLQVTERIEKKLQETPYFDYVKSYTKPGQSVVYVNLKESTTPEQIAWTWYQVRKKISDIRTTLPADIQGPFFNDEFGDVFGIVYGLTYDGFTLRETRDFAETARTEFLRAPDVAKVEIFGDQQEKIYLTISPQKLASLGVNTQQIAAALAEQNAVLPSGIINTSTENILMEVSGALLSVQNIKAIRLYVNNRFYNLSDLATVEHGYADPPSKLFRVNGKPAIGIGLSMRTGGNNLEFGQNLERISEELQARFPVGINVERVSNQPEVVTKAIGSFTEALFEAIIIVLAVSFLSLGLRAGLVVALSIPLVLSIVFAGMELWGISLQRISLGALIIALGLLVDDAMITVEMMISKIEEGFDRMKAATFAYTSTAFPMLTGTLVTIFGFWPIGFAKNGTGQYCFSLFAVIAISLVASWFVAVIFSPVIGVTVLSSKFIKKKDASEGHGSSVILSYFRHVLLLCMRHRWLTLIVTLGIFILSLVGTRFIQQQFFPGSDRPEVMVTLNTPKYSSIYDTRAEADKVQKILEDDKALGAESNIISYSAYIGGGAIRFYLPMDVQLDNDFISQFIIVTKDLAARDRLMDKLNQGTAGIDFDNVVVRVQRLELGPPIGWPVQYRVSGATPDEAREIASRMAQILEDSGLTRTVNFDWFEKNKALRVEVNQDKARQIGLSSEELSKAFQAVLSGQSITQIRDSIYLIDLVGRGDASNRNSVEAVRSLQIQLPNNASVSLGDIATVTYALEDGYVWRRDRLPTITVQADPAPGLEAPTVFSRLRPQIQAFAKTLAPGQLIVEGGTVEKSSQSNAALAAEMPTMAALMLIVLMIQLQSFSRLFLVISVAPLGIIGVVVALLGTGTPMGFVSILGIIALAGMIIRNSVILIDQIEHNHTAGLDPWHAVVEATLHRLRPILLTASAAILGMIPILRDVFWGPMACTVIGGLAGATLLTLLFLPALYIAWFRIKEPE